MIGKLRLPVPRLGKARVFVGSPYNQNKPALLNGKQTITEKLHLPHFLVICSKEFIPYPGVLKLYETFVHLY
jgi:hypothetical protein